MTFKTRTSASRCGCRSLGPGIGLSTPTRPTLSTALYGERTSGMAALARNLRVSLSGISANLPAVFLMGWNFALAWNMGTLFHLLLCHRTNPFVKRSILDCSASSPVSRAMVAPVATLCKRQVQPLALHKTSAMKMSDDSLKLWLTVRFWHPPRAWRRSSGRPRDLLRSSSIRQCWSALRFVCSGACKGA